MNFKTVIFSLALFAITLADEHHEDNDVERTRVPMKTLVAPLVVAGLAKPFIKPLVKPALIAAAAGAVGGSMARPININIETPAKDVEDRTVSVTITCGDLMGYPCYLLPSGCYCPVPVQQPWNEAFAICRAAGKRLISIESPSKQIELQLYLPHILGSGSNIYNNIGFWTSGAYCVTSFTWTALPQYFTYTNWYSSNEPTVFGYPNGACVRAVPSSGYAWDDIDCGQYLPFICEP